MSAEGLQKLLVALDAARGHDSITPELAARQLREHGLALTPAEWLQCVSLFPFAPSGVAPALTTLLAEFLRASKARSLVDPWFATWSPSLAAAEDAGLEKVTLVSPLDQDAALAQALTARAQVRALVGVATRDPTLSLGTADAVVSIPPVNAPARAMTVKAGGGERSVRDHEGLLLLPLAASLLAGDGYAVILVPNLFFLRESEAKSSLSDLGLYADAAIDLPPGSLLGSSIGASLLFLRKTPTDTVFVGQIDGEREHDATLVQNLIAHRYGRDLSLGVIIPWNEFRGYSAVVYARQLKKVASQAGAPVVALGDITLSIRRAAKKGSASLEPAPENSIYLPTMPTSRVTLAGVEQPAVQETYLVQLDPARANATYVTGFLNSDLGREFRTAASTGVTIQRVTQEQARSIRVLLPDPGVQARLVALNERLAALHNELSELSSEIWPSPKKVEQLEEQAAKLNHADRFEDWLETLPHPIASVLWTYHTLAGDEQKRYGQLIHFFEALTEFLATWFLSAYWADREARDLVTRALRSGHMSLDRASFGTWATILEVLSSRTRKVIAERPAETAEARERLFGTLEAGVLEALTDKHLQVLVAEANKLRNLWQGHTGYVPEIEAHRRHLEVIRLLNEVRGIIGRKWARYELVRPGSCTTTDSEFVYTVERVVGARVPFAQKQITLAHPVKSGELFFSGDGSTRAVRLLPLIKLLPQPKGLESACFFYNRAEAGAERFVSYAYGPEAAVVERYPEVLDVLKGLSGEGSSGSAVPAKA